MERIMLYVVVLGLAIAVGWLAVTEEPGAGCTGCGQDLGPRLDAIDTAIADLGKAVAAHGDETATALDGIGAAIAGVAKKVDDNLAGLERRVADAVADKLLATGCQLAKAGDECGTAAPQPPCPAPDASEGCPDLRPLTVKSKFTLLYENARLNEDGELAPNSVGVKLTDRHLDRLRLLASAFKPCHEKDDPVRFAVTGYSSSAEFRSQPDGGPLPDSEALNRETANRRAQIVRDYLRSQGFEVEPPRSDLPRPYRDDAQPGMDQQALNRTVFMELASAGACDLSR